MADPQQEISFDHDDLPTIRDHEEILTWPRHEPNIDPIKDRPSKILAFYQLSTFIPCSLPDRTLHGEGWLLQLPDGRVTNVGRCCAETKYHISKDHLRKADEMVRLRNRRDRLLELVGRRQEIYDRIDRLRYEPLGAEWVCKSQAAFYGAYPAEITSELQTRAIRRDYAVAVMRKRNKEERDAFRVAQSAGTVGDLRSTKGEHYATEVIGYLQGLDIFATSIAKHSALTIRTRLEALAQADLFKESANRVLQRLTSIKNLEEEISHYERLIEAGRKFFRPENLRLVPKVTFNQRFERDASKITWDYEMGQVRREAV